MIYMTCTYINSSQTLRSAKTVQFMGVGPLVSKTRRNERPSLCKLRNLAVGQNDSGKGPYKVQERQQPEIVRNVDVEDHNGALKSQLPQVFMAFLGGLMKCCTFVVRTALEDP